MVWRSRCGAVFGAALALAVAAGCTPSPSSALTPSASAATSATTAAASASPTATPTPTPTWSADQAAAIEAVNNFTDAEDRIGADPSAFTEKQMTDLLSEFSGGEVLEATVRWHLLLKKNGYRLLGAMKILSTNATKPADNGRGIEVAVTRCQDQRQGTVVDKDGKPVTGDDFEFSEYNLRQFAVRRPTGEAAFRVFGFATINGKCP